MIKNIFFEIYIPCNRIIKSYSGNLDLFSSCYRVDLVIKQYTFLHRSYCFRTLSAMDRIRYSLSSYVYKVMLVHSYSFGVFTSMKEQYYELSRL